MAGQHIPTRRSSWLIVRAVEAELTRQASEGMLSHVSRMDDSGHIQVAGTIDLARLANTLEDGFRREFFAAALPVHDITGGGA